jgi:hypothetical protein
MSEPPQMTSQAVKAALLIVAIAFLGYGIYWTINGVIWANTLLQVFGTIFSSQGTFLGDQTFFHASLLMAQEIFSVVNCCFILLTGTVFAFYATVLYLKRKTGYLFKIKWTLILTAVFYLLLVPASIHHLIGYVMEWPMISIGVGLSYLLQALLISPSFLILSKKIRNPQDSTQIYRWVAIAVPLFVFAMWAKYLFLWADTLLPMGPTDLGVWSIVGAVNSVVTLLATGILTTVTTKSLYRKQGFNNKYVGTALILFGTFFVVDSVVALFVPIYAAFWYLTDFWMLTVPILGVAVLFTKGSVHKKNLERASLSFPRHLAHRKNKVLNSLSLCPEPSAQTHPN